MIAENIVCQVEYFDHRSKTIQRTLGIIDSKKLKKFNEKGVKFLSIRNFDDQTIEWRSITKISVL